MAHELNCAVARRIGFNDSTLVGGKAANLSRLAATHRVPPGFCLPASVRVSDTDIDAAYYELAACFGAEPAVAVRSSAIDEDGASASFAGQHDTFLNVRGLADLHAAIERCLESPRAPRHGLPSRARPRGP
jgi:pyruvate,water dikinase